VLEFEGRTINRSTDLPPLVGLTPPGTRAEFSVFRRNEGIQTVVVTLGELREEASDRPPARPERSEKISRFGLRLNEISSIQRKNLDIDHGVSVAGVEEGQARAAGLRPGDVILDVDGKRVSDISSFHRLMDHTPRGRAVVLRIRRGMGTLFLALNPAG
jgi:serine protease Do